MRNGGGFPQNHRGPRQGMRPGPGMRPGGFHGGHRPPPPPPPPRFRRRAGCMGPGCLLPILAVIGLAVLICSLLW